MHPLTGSVMTMSLFTHVCTHFMHMHAYSHTHACIYTDASHDKHGMDSVLARTHARTHTMHVQSGLTQPWHGFGARTHARTHTHTMHVQSGLTQPWHGFGAHTHTQTQRQPSHGTIFVDHVHTHMHSSTYTRTHTDASHDQGIDVRISVSPIVA
jgi:hypothetical protein